MTAVLAADWLEEVMDVYTALVLVTWPSLLTYAVYSVARSLWRRRARRSASGAVSPIRRWWPSGERAMPETGAAAVLVSLVQDIAAPLARWQVAIAHLAAIPPPPGMDRNA